MSDSNKRGIVFKEYMRLLPLMKKYPHLTLKDVIDLNETHPDANIEELDKIVQATFNY